MRQTAKKRWRIAAVLSLCVVFLGILLYDALSPRTAQTADTLMDTNVQATIVGKNADNVAAGCLDTVRSVEQAQLSRFLPDAEIARINASTGQAVPVDDKTVQLLQDMLSLQQKTNNAFSITLGQISALWNFTDLTPQVPTAREIEAMLSAPRNLNIEGNQVHVTQPGCLDLGAVGKGYACDQVRSYLETQNVEEAVVSVGGSILLYGARNDFTVGIRDPKGGADDLLGTLQLGEACVSTSGGYERYFMQDGVRYHHILDGRTGYPADSDLESVTIIAESGTMSDALSTACFVFGYQASLPLLAQYQVDAVFLLKSGEIRVVGYSQLQPKPVFASLQNDHAATEGPAS